MVSKDPESNQEANIKYQANSVLRNLLRFVVGQFVHGVPQNAESKETPHRDDEGLGVLFNFEASKYEDYQLEAPADVLVDAVE